MDASRERERERKDGRSIGYAGPDPEDVRARGPAKTEDRITLDLRQENG